MKEFFRNKKNLILVIMIGVSLLAILVASFLDIFVPISCIFFGITCIYGSYLMLLKYVEMRNNKISEFISDENQYRKKKTKFLESESKINMILLTGLFFIMGAILIYYAIRVFMV